MNKISLLDQNTIDKIAAGEVIERPASIVKELVENAIDAGATAITVEIKEGGISFIRITDNGAGIAQEQVPLAFLRHATSKIQVLDDLQTITSLGFRGEALSSIAAVSQVELITKTHSGFAGVRYIIEGGKEKSLEEIGAPDGTTFLIRNLFYNTPARKKFLKSPVTEGNYISNSMEQLAMSHPDISFKYMQNGQTKLHTSGNGNFKEVIYQIYGRDITRDLLEINYQDELLEVSGYIGKPTISRGNRNFENYYVNGRYIKSKILMKAIEDGYRSFMMQHKYPFTALSITMKGDTLDINVHPTKMEVRFENQEGIYRSVYRMIHDALIEKDLIPEVTFDPNKKDSATQMKTEKLRVPEPFEVNRRAAYHSQQAPYNPNQYVKPQGVTYDEKSKQSSAGYGTERAADRVRETAVYQTNHQGEQTRKMLDAVQAGNDVVQAVNDTSLAANSLAQSVHNTDQHINAIPQLENSTEPANSTVNLVNSTEMKATEIPECISNPTQQTMFEEKGFLHQETKKMHTIIGQLFDTYWLVQMEDKLYIIDQHAAHEKVLYERLLKNLKEKKITSQYLTPTIIVSLTLQQSALLEEYMDVFADFGFEIESFGGKEYSIRAVPDNLFGLAKESLFIEMLDNLSNETHGKPIDIIIEKLASMACKAAIKGNHSQSRQEIEHLIDELLQLENPYNCPHGRPTIISMTKYELEKKFKRII